jgi:hypothetical protein
VSKACIEIKPDTEMWHHEGRNKGPITQAGKARSAAAHIKTGEFTIQAIQERSEKLAEMIQCMS